MGRRRKKQTDLEESIHDKTNGAARPGHNGGALSDDERRALTLHHAAKWAAANAIVEAAKTDRKAIEDQAKADLGKGAVADVKALNATDEVKARAAIENALRIARWKGMPVGSTMNLFDVPVNDRAAEEGMTAGMAGDVCKPPAHLTAEGAQRWTDAWHKGQEILASAIFKRRPDQPKDAPAVDTSDVPFAPFSEHEAVTLPDGTPGHVSGFRDDKIIVTYMRDGAELTGEYEGRELQRAPAAAPDMPAAPQPPG